MKPKDRDFKSTENYQDGKYRVMSMTDGDSNLRRIVCETEGVCLIPFDTNEKKIRNIYLARYMDYLSNEQGHTCITSDFTDNSDTVFEELDNLINGELGLKVDVDDLYFLGASLINADEPELDKIRSDDYFYLGKAIFSKDVAVLENIQSDDIYYLGKGLITKDMNYLDQITTEKKQ